MFRALIDTTSHWPVVTKEYIHYNLLKRLCFGLHLPVWTSRYNSKILQFWKIMMQYLFFSLFLLSRYFSVSTSATAKGLLGNREESPSFERNNTPFQSERIPSFLFGIYEHFKTQTAFHGRERSLESFQAKRKGNSVTPLEIVHSKSVFSQTKKHTYDQTLNAVTFFRRWSKKGGSFHRKKTAISNLSAQNGAKSNALVKPTSPSNISFLFAGNQETGEFYFPSGAVFKTPLEALLKAKFFVSVPKLPRKKMTVTIYEADSGVKVSSRHLSFTTSGWLSLNAVNLVNQWISRSQYTFPGLKVIVKGSKGGEESATQVRQLRLVVYSAKPDHYGEDFLQSSLVVNEGGIPFAKGRIRREATTTQSKKNQSESPISCSRNDMMITSSDFGKRDGLTLLHPRVFNAYQCSGECSSKEKMNNSKLRALIMRDNGHSVRDSKSCCVPSKLRSIVMMQRTAERNYLISTLKNMIVESCTCY